MGPVLTLARLVAVAALAISAGCGDGDGDGGAEGEGEGEGGPTVVVTTTILGDVVSNLVAGSGIDVEVVMPVGADPHEFAPSARQAEAIEGADLVVINGAGFEEHLLDVVEAAEDGGTPVFAFAEHVELIDGDPHFWTDPTRVAAGVGALVERLATLEGGGTVRAQADAYLEALTAVDGEVAATLAAVPADRRVLVTNHEVFAYFAERYEFDVVGAVIPSPTTGAEPSAADLEALAEVIRERGVPAIFGEATHSSQLAEALADLVGTDVQVVELFTESLGEPGSGAETYLDLLRTDATRIADALG